MAKYHEDTVEKHEITKEEILFLKGLQKEMNTQDTICQADPRFWVVAGTQKIYVGKEYSEGEELVEDGSTLADGIEEAVRYIQEALLPDLNEDSEKFEYILEEENVHSFKSWKFTKIDKTYNKEAENYVEGNEVIMEQDYIVNIEELIEALEDSNAIYQGKYDVVYYRNEHYRYPDTMFLTNKSCKKHIELNHYHYDADVHSYAMTAWRSPEVEKLFKILQQVDWDKML